MSIKRAFLQRISNALLWLLPGYLYVHIARWAIPFLDSRRRDFRSRVRKCNSGYIFESANFSIYFYSPYNVGRYLFTSSDSSIINRMRKKYLGKWLEVPVGGVVIDVGANVGEFSLAVSDQGARVYACEPDPGPFESLRKNLGRLSNAHCHQLAFGEQSGRLPFYISSQHNDSSFLKPETGFERVEYVAVVAIDDFCLREKLDKVSLLKVEAEGYEPEILRGASWALSNLVRQVAVDGGPERHGYTTIDDCEDILVRHGFSVNRDGSMLYGIRDCRD